MQEDWGIITQHLQWEFMLFISLQKLAGTKIKTFLVLCDFLEMRLKECRLVGFSLHYGN